MAGSCSITLSMAVSITAAFAFITETKAMEPSEASTTFWGTPEMVPAKDTLTENVGKYFGMGRFSTSDGHLPKKAKPPFPGALAERLWLTAWRRCACPCKSASTRDSAGD